MNTLFAELSGGTVFLMVCVVLLYAAGYGYYCWYMSTYHPDQWAAMQQRAHERKMLAQRLQAERELQRREHERLRQEEARRNRNRTMLGIGGTLLRVFLGHRH